MSESIYHAIELANSGHRHDALDILRGITAKDASQSAAWKWLAYLSLDPREALYAAHHVELLDPHDPWLQQAIPALTNNSRLAAAKPQSKPGGRWLRTAFNVAVGAVLTVLIVLTVTQWMGILPRTGVASIVSDQDPISLRADAQNQPGLQASNRQQPALATAAGDAADLTIDVDVTTNTTYYSFVATTEEEVRQALYHDGPQLENGSQAIAVTSYQMWIEWQGRQSVSGCEMTNSTVHLDVNYTLPQWVPDGSAEPALYQDWDRFNEHVITHEEVHGEMARQCADQLAERLQAGRERASCGDLEQWINETMNEVYSTCEQLQTDFDAVEGHAAFPLNTGG